MRGSSFEQLFREVSQPAVNHLSAPDSPGYRPATETINQNGPFGLCTRGIRQLEARLEQSLRGKSRGNALHRRLGCGRWSVDLSSSEAEASRCLADGCAPCVHLQFRSGS